MAYIEGLKAELIKDLSIKSNSIYSSYSNRGTCSAKGEGSATFNTNTAYSTTHMFTPSDGQAISLQPGIYLLTYISKMDGYNNITSIAAICSRTIQNFGWNYYDGFSWYNLPAGRSGASNPNRGYEICTLETALHQAGVTQDVYTQFTINNAQTVYFVNMYYDWGYTTHYIRKNEIKLYRLQ